MRQVVIEALIILIFMLLTALTLLYADRVRRELNWQHKNSLYLKHDTCRLL